MTPAWAVQLNTDAADALGPLRCTRGLEVCVDGGAVWLRGEDPALLEALLVRRLPATGRYLVVGDQLFPVGRRLPVGSLPAGHWQPLSEWVTVDVSRPLFPGQVEQTIVLSLVRQAGTGESNLLVTSVGACQAWAERASRLRLKPLSVAIDQAVGRVALRGHPLPPLPGNRYVINERVGLPAGYVFSQPITHGEAASIIDLPKDSIALFEPDGSWSALRDDVLIAATRSTLRLLPEPGSAPAADRVAT